MAATPKVLVPPGREIGYANCHWVKASGQYGHNEMEIWQWQPGVKKWCRPNEHASGRDHDLIDYTYVARCPLPPFREELDEFMVVVEKLRSGIALTALSEAEQSAFNRMIYENLQNYPK